MKMVATAFVILLAAPGLASAASIEGTWRVHGDRFASPSTIAFDKNLFRAHLGSKVISGEFALRGDAPKFQNVIVTEGSARPVDAHDPKALAYWRKLEAILLGATAIRQQGEELLVQSGTSTVTFDRVSR